MRLNTNKLQVITLQIKHVEEFRLLECDAEQSIPQDSNLHNHRCECPEPNITYISSFILWDSRK
jgi:hypothetical protein